MPTRRQFLKMGGASAAALYMSTRFRWLQKAYAQIAGGSLAPGDVPKYQLPLVKPPAMPLSAGSNRNKDKFKISVQQFQQQILSGPHPPTTVWSYGPSGVAPTLANGYFYPAFTVEATANKDVQVVWKNELVDPMGVPLPHLLPVDPSLHWANPVGRRDTRPNPTQDPTYWNSPYIDGNGNYIGPVPMVVHVHGAHTAEDSDGYPEAWYLPTQAALDPNLTWATGTFFDYFNTKYAHGWMPGSVGFKYPNDQPATTLWYHDHTLGMTRLNVYAGPAGFWLIRGGLYDADLGYVAPGVGDDAFGEYTEIPIAIQDRSFNANGSLFYPDNRAFFEGLNPEQLQIPFTFDQLGINPDLNGWGLGCDNLVSDVAHIWQPEFFGNMMVVNGRTWPYLEVEAKRYRFRLLNGCNSRFLILKMSNDMPFYQIGAEQGFLPEPVPLTQLLMAPAERADVIVDFTGLAAGTEIILLNLGPDEPFGGGEPPDDFDAADPDSTGQVMQFRVVNRNALPQGELPTTLPAAPPLAGATSFRDVSLNEEESKNIFVSGDADAPPILYDCDSDTRFGPTAALLGTLNPDGSGNPLLWMDPVSENTAVGTIEEWAIHNFTADAHPIHVHLVHFEVVNREVASEDSPNYDPDNPNIGAVRDPEAWEVGFKDTVIAYPGEITRIKALYDVPGRFVWHCHIVEHEDNEMMRPYQVGPNVGYPTP